MECPGCGGHVSSLLKCERCGEDFLPQDLRPTYPSDASPISEADARAGLGSYGVAANASSFTDDWTRVRAVQAPMFSTRTLFIIALVLIAWIALSG